MRERSLSSIEKKEFSLAGFPARQRVLMLLLNFVPLLHFSLILFVSIVPQLDLLPRIILALFVLYILPAIIARLLLAFFPLDHGEIRSDSPQFLTWWALAQLQTIFNRLTFLDEFLRLIPGAYSLWLRLWGSKIGRLTFWSAGTVVLDRSFLQIGDDVLFGAAVRLNPHVLKKDHAGKFILVLAPVVIEDAAVIGGYSLLTAGSHVFPAETPRAHLILPPFSSFRDGKRSKAEGIDD